MKKEEIRRTKNKVLLSGYLQLIGGLLVLCSFIFEVDEVKSVSESAPLFSLGCLILVLSIGYYIYGFKYKYEKAMEIEVNDITLKDLLSPSSYTPFK